MRGTGERAIVRVSFAMLTPRPRNSEDRAAVSQLAEPMRCVHIGAPLSVRGNVILCTVLVTMERFESRTPSRSFYDGRRLVDVVGRLWSTT